MTPIYLQLIYGSQGECGESPVGLVDSTEKKFGKIIFLGRKKPFVEVESDGIECFPT